MIIKKKVDVKKQGFTFNIFTRYYFFSSLLFLALFLLLFFNTGYWNNYKRNILDRFYISSVNNYLKILPIGVSLFKGVFHNIPEVNLKISFPNIVKLEKDRKEVLDKGYQYGDVHEFLKVPIEINYRNKIYNADLRLKGDRDIHFKEAKYSSYRIYVKDDGRIFNLRKFSLMKPRARNYVYEWIFHQFLKETNLINLKYIFIDLKINGDNQGLYVVEEGFGKILLERNEKRNGPIFSTHEEFSYSFKSAKFEIYNKKYWQQPENIKLSEAAAQKLKDFINNKKNAEEIFDIESWASFFAVADLNSTPHALLLKSVRFYYNPINGKFEPIGVDGHRTIPNYNKNISNWKKISKDQAATSHDQAKICNRIINEKGETGTKEVRGHLVDECNLLIYKFFYNDDNTLNKSFYSIYRNKILNISSRDFLDSFYKKNDSQIKKINSKIYGDYFFADHMFYYGPGLYYYSNKDIYIRADYLIKKFQSEPQSVFLSQEEQNILVENISKNNNNLIVKELYCTNSKNYEKKNIVINYNLGSNFNSLNKINLFDFNENKILNCSNALILNKFSNKKFLKPINTLNSNIKIIYKNTNKDRFKKYFFAEGEFLKFIENNITISENIFIPSGFIVKINPGQKIKLIDNSFIFSDSAWIVEGNENIVEISGEKNNFGGGLFINDPTNTSLLKNVRFRYLTGLKSDYYNSKNNEFIKTISTYPGIQKNVFKEKIGAIGKNSNILNNQFQLMGSVNFYKSKVILENALFEKISSEDALNLIQSEFNINNVKFLENASDAIDVDFSNGSISNAEFIHIGNDAIDLSGSNVKITEIKFNLIGDKMLSVGENSIAKVSNFKGINSHVGIASKDGSLIELNKINLKNVKIGLSAYQKKKEYLPGRIVVDNITIENFLKKWLTDNSSTILFKGKLVDSKTDNILPIVYRKDLEIITKLN